MGLGGGSWSAFNKPIDGFYSVAVTKGRITNRTTNGIVAGGITADWGPDGEIYEIQKDSFFDNPVITTGYEYDAPQNTVLREIFSNANILKAYRLNKNGVKAAAVGCGEAKYTGVCGNNISVSVLKNVIDPTKYDVTTYFNGVARDYQTTNSATKKTLTVAKKEQQKNEKIDAPSATITAESNVVTVTYADMVSSYPTTATKVTKDGQAVEANIEIKSNGLVDTITFQEGTEDGKYKVEAIVKGADEKTLTSTEITKAESEYTKGEDTPGEGPSAPTVTIDFQDNDVTVEFSDKLVEYPATAIEVEFSDEVTTSGFTATSKKVTFNDTAQSGDYTIKAYLKKSGAEKKLIASAQATVTVAEDGVSGADGSELKDNDFVVFEKTLIEENAAYAFEGGTSGDAVTVEDHNTFLNLLEDQSFNELFYDGQDEAVKELYYEFNKRLRDQRGDYFRLTLEDYAKANYEGVTSVYNKLKTKNDYVTTTTPWLAGAFASLSLNQELTNYVYNGELDIAADLTQSRMELLINSGHLFFHKTGINEVSTYEDVNTFRSFTNEKNEEISQNRLVRIVDYIHNSLAEQINRRDIGKLANTPLGRNILWTRVEGILSELVTLGAIDQYDPSDITVNPIDGQKYSVYITANISMPGVIRKVYLTTYIES